MLRSYRHFILSVVGILLAASFVWIWLRPNYPVLPTNEYKKAEQGQHSPGSPACYPSRLNSLPESEAADERYRCEQAAEKHRIESDDLVQQTRAADAAVVMVGLTYNQSLMMLAGTIFGLLTLVAAFAAVLYAKRAASAAERSLDHAQDVAATDLRPWLKIQVEPDWVSIGPDQLIISLRVTLRNIGRTPAIAVKVGSRALCVGPVHSDDCARFEQLNMPDASMSPWCAVLPGDEITGQELVFLDWAAASGPSNWDGDTPSKALRPVVGINVTYASSGGDLGRTARSFWVGVEPSKVDDVDSVEPIWNHYDNTIALRVRPGLQSEIE